MVTVPDESVRRLGVWSALLCTIWSLAHVVAQLGEWAGLFGRPGAPAVYDVQLAVVLPRLARGDTAGIELLIFEPFGAFLYAVDVLGYSLRPPATPSPSSPPARTARPAGA
jgi:hypothetical protein